jgi:hypothetical protein
LGQGSMRKQMKGVEFVYIDAPCVGECGAPSSRYDKCSHGFGWMVYVSEANVLFARIHERLGFRV